MARIVRFHQYGDPSVLKIEDLDVRLLPTVETSVTGFKKGDVVSEGPPRIQRSDWQGSRQCLIKRFRGP
jgi:hypothetical protein